MGTIAAYVRVSSKAQDHATQRHAIEKESARRGDSITAWYAEKQSGKTLARPELHLLRQDAAAGRIGKLYLFKLDRLTRSGVADTFEVIKELREAKVEVVTVQDDFPMAGKTADLILAVMAWAAEVERLHIGERISAARERVEAKGGHWGRPQRMTPAQREDAEERRRKGQSLRRIAIALKLPRVTVWRALNPEAEAASRQRRVLDAVQAR